MLKRNLAMGGLVALLLAVAVILVTPRKAEASIHEIIAALCRAGGEEVVPPGQNRNGNSFVRALQATGFISSIDTSDPTNVIVHFDPTVPNSKYISAGFDLTIPNGAGPGVDLTLSPLVIPDPAFPAHANCANLQ
jgi:hypothetical protein